MIDRYRVVSLNDVAEASKQIGQYLERRKRLRKSESIQ